ncbi:MAG: polysaccharide pyruvyl transferase family protein [Thermodesulfobacteriota bacterium]
MGSLRFLHLANYHSDNIGNGALIAGTERVLREDLGRELTFIPEPWADYTALNAKPFDEAFVARVNREADALLVGAAVTLDGRAQYRHTGMRFNLPLPLWDRIHKPIIFYAISHRHWPLQTYHHADRLAETLRYVESRPNILFSVRNDGTKEWLERLLGFASVKVAAIPDPALFVPTQEAWHPELRDDCLNLIISLNNEDPVYRYGGKIQELAWRNLRFLDQMLLTRVWRHLPEWRWRRRRFLTALAQAVTLVAREGDLNLILCPHSSDDLAIMEEFIRRLPPRLAMYQVTCAGLLPESRAPYVYDLYRRADLALSMRIHSMSPALGLGTPVITLDTDTRMTQFMKTAGLADFALHIFDPDLPGKVHQLIKFILTNKKVIKTKIQRICTDMRKQTRAFNQTVASLLNVAA